MPSGCLWPAESEAEEGEEEAPAAPDLGLWVWQRWWSPPNNAAPALVALTLAVASDATGAATGTVEERVIVGEGGEAPRTTCPGSCMALEGAGSSLRGEPVP